MRPPGMCWAVCAVVSARNPLRGGISVDTSLLNGTRAVRFGIDSGCHVAARYRAGEDRPSHYGVTVCQLSVLAAVGGSELACQESMAPRRLRVENATGRTVRNTSKITSRRPEDAQALTVRPSVWNRGGVVAHEAADEASEVSSPLLVRSFRPAKCPPEATPAGGDHLVATRRGCRKGKY